VRRLAALGVIPVPQGRFVNEIGDGMLDALGPERSTWCYRQRSFLDAGLTLPGSSDRPVVDGAPLLGIHDMVNQRTARGRPFCPAEAITPLEALRAYTLGSARAAFREGVLGSIAPGKLADLTVLSADPTAIDPAGIAEIRVLATMVGGAAVHDVAGLA
jgi:predicted amidohydrolase YtcJ